jgi:glycosyltransferase involved in cell wall biosynthesis
VGDYLPALIDSLIRGANSPEVMLVFVNDCTPDDSMQICRALLAQRAAEVRFQYELIDRGSNGGLSEARNTGLDRVRSPYLGFIDSDDMVASGYYSTLAPHLADGRWDVVEFNLAEFRDVPPDPPAGGVASEVDQLGPFKHGFFAWARVYRSVVVQGMRFPPQRLYEDIHYVMRAYGLAQRILRVEAPLVLYRKRDGSITARRDHRFADQLRNLTAGLEASWSGQRSRQRALWLTARKGFVILLKGLRIKETAERQRFLQACREPLDQLGALARREPSARGARSVLGGCRLLLGIAASPQQGR